MYHIRFCIVLFGAILSFGLEVPETGDVYVKRDSVCETDNNLMHRVCTFKGKLIPETNTWRLHFKTWYSFFHTGTEFYCIKGTNFIICKSSLKDASI
jgi:hypothetical protein